MKKDINNILMDLTLKENNNNIIFDKTEYISDYLEKNKLSLDLIPLNDNLCGEENQNIQNLNIILSTLNTYERLKLNVTFKYNITYIIIYKKIIPILNQLKILEGIENQIDSLSFKKEFDEIEKEINGINRKVILFDRKKIFDEISQDEFFEKVKNEFENINLVDISGKEIVNFYFYTYLLKRNLYDEKSYKNSDGFSENF